MSYLSFTIYYFDQVDTKETFVVHLVNVSFVITISILVM